MYEEKIAYRLRQHIECILLLLRLWLLVLGHGMIRVVHEIVQVFCNRGILSGCRNGESGDEDKSEMTTGTLMLFVISKLDSNSR